MRIRFGMLCILFFTFACKPSHQEQINYPVVDLRGESNQDIADPFPTDVFTGKCEPSTAQLTNPLIKVSVETYEDSDGTSNRAARLEKREIQSAFNIDKGVVSAPGIVGDSISVGGLLWSKESLGNFESFQDGAAAVENLSNSASLNLGQNVAPESTLRICAAGVKGNVYDATDDRVKQNAALGFVTLLSTDRQVVQNFMGNARYLNLFENQKELPSAGLSLLTESSFDYEFVAKEGAQTSRYLGRVLFSDNLQHRVLFRYRKSSSGASLTQARQFVVYPHSSVFQKLHGQFGSYWDNPFIIGHEFGHLVYSASVARALSKPQNAVAPTTSLWSFADFIPEFLRKTENENTYLIIREVLEKQNDPLSSQKDSFTPLPEKKGTGFSLLGEQLLGTTDELTKDEKKELVRRVAYVERAFDEASADMMGAALEGSYGGLKAGCLGPDRNPRVDYFGEGRETTPVEKRIPTTLEMYSPLSGNLAWYVQSNSSESQGILANSSDCSSTQRVTLRSSYTLAGIVTHWLEQSVRHYTGQSFTSLPDTARLELVLDILKALKSNWEPWFILQHDGYWQGKFDDYYSLPSSLDFEKIVLKTSLSNSVLSIANGLFNRANSDSWVSRYATLLDSKVSPNDNANMACAEASKHTLLPKDICLEK